jgi:leucyl-tRNA synthetase
MIPFTPHLSYECLELMGCKNVTEWPEVEKNILMEIDFAIQINGKTRDVIKVKKDSSEEIVNKKALTDSRAKKYIENKKIFKTIFVNNKIINYIIKD